MVVLVASGLVGCGPAIQGELPGGGDSNGSEPVPVTGASTTSGAPDRETSTTLPQTDSAGTDPDDGAGSGFGPRPDGFVLPRNCDPFTQTCPAGYKCVPCGDDNESSYTGTCCVPVVPSPFGVGETCTMMDSPVSGLDDCDAQSICYHLGPDLEGTCVPLCQGSAFNWICAPGKACTVCQDCVAPVCLDLCDPIFRECAPDLGCYPFPGGPGFGCIRPPPSPVAVGEPRDFATACVPGSVCLAAEVFPDCRGFGCCAPYCDLTAADPDAPCASMGTQCEAYFGDNPLRGLEHVGVCAIAW